MADLIDNMRYIVLAEHQPDGSRLVRRRWSMWDDSVGARMEAIRWYRSTGNRVDVLAGKLGQERLREYVAKNEVIRIDGSGVPATVCADIDRCYHEEAE